MPKGVFSQTFCVLTSRVVTVDQIADALGEFEVLGTSPAMADWQLGGPSLVLAYRPEVNGKVAIDVVDRRWPDEMGEPRADKMTFSAWSMGYFGPFTYPNGLNRAGQHSWGWASGRSIVHSHTGFIRLRVSYVFGGNPKAPVLPVGYQPIAEMEFLTRLTQAVLEVPGTLCYFNPGGEVLRDKDSLKELLALGDRVPIAAWCNVRFFKVNEDWILMDTVGNHQLDVPDIESIFPAVDYEPARIDAYLRDVSMYLIDKGANVLRDGDRIDGPGETELSWRVSKPKDPICDPPRPVCRLTAAKDQDALGTLLH